MRTLRSPLALGLLVVLVALCTPPPVASAQAAPPTQEVTVSSFYGELTVTPDSVRYTTPTAAVSAPRDLVAVLMRTDWGRGGTLPDRQSPWVASDVESHLVFAAADRPLPDFPPLRAGLPDDSLAVLAAQIAAAADSIAAANVLLSVERDSLATSLSAMEDERASVLDTLRALLARLVNPQ